MFTNIKKTNFLSFRLILNFIFLIKNQINKKNGISTPICFNKNNKGYLR